MNLLRSTEKLKTNINIGIYRLFIKIDKEN